MYIKHQIQTYKIQSFGCRVNQAEKETISQEMNRVGFVPVEAKPDLYIINSCAVTVKAEREVRNFIYQVKKNLPTTHIILTGCVATYWKKYCRSNHQPKVNLVIENSDKEFFVKLLTKRYILTKKISSTLDISLKVDKYGKTGRRFIKIQDGCHRFCTYCIVPYMRGQPRSYSIENIVKKVNDTPNSIKEIIFTAINTEDYGYKSEETLTDLLRHTIKYTTIERISMGSINPWSLDDEFISFYRKQVKSTRFVHFFHIPLQSGSNKILTLMKRGYSTEEFLTSIFSIYRLNPLALIATDVIVGYLDESDTDFQNTYDFLNSAPINKFHVFRFSKRENTAAYYLARKLKEPSEATKKKRSQALISLSLSKYHHFITTHIGKSFTGLFYGKISGEHQLCLLNNQVPAYIKTNKNLSGEIKNVRITEFRHNQIFGKLI